MNLRSMVRFASSLQGQPSTVVLDGRTMQSNCKSSPRSGYEGYKCKRGSKVHMAVDMPSHLLAVHVTPANELEQAQVLKLCEAVQTVTSHTVELALADQGYSGEQPRRDARAQGIELQVIKLAEANKGFVLLPKRWVVERSFPWAARFRRLAKDCERLPDALHGLHFLVFVILMLPKATPLLTATGNA